MKAIKPEGCSLIYLLEDNEDLSEVLLDLINTVGGFQGVAFKHDRELLVTLQQKLPSQIVLNIQTPAEKRLQLIQAIRKMCPELPLLALTIQNPTLFQALMTADHNIRFIKKPFALDEFQSALNMTKTN